MFSLAELIVKLGLLTLIYHTARDMTSGKIDSRKNYFMMGATLVGYLALEQNIFIFLAYVGLAIGIGKLYERTYAKGDIQTFYWIFPILHLISPAALFHIQFPYTFLFLFALGIIGYFVSFIKYEKKVRTSTPGMINILTAYLLIVGYYWYYALWPQGCAISWLCV